MIMTRCRRCRRMNNGDPWYCPQCGKETTLTPHDDGVEGDAAPLRPWECSSNSVPDLTKACRRRIWLPIFWWGHCHRCMRAAAAEVGW